jgi:hypothetical protein
MRRRNNVVKLSILAMPLILLLLAQSLALVDATRQVVILNNHIGYLEVTAANCHVMGEVQNTGDEASYLVKITATLYDSRNVVLATPFTYWPLWVLPPGQKAPFDIELLDETQSRKVDHYELAISSGLPHEGLPVGLEILSHSQDISEYAITIVGEVKNIGDREAHAVKIVAPFYDSAGKVVGVGYAPPDPKDLAPGQNAPFKVLLPKDCSPLGFFPCSKDPAALDLVGKRVVATYVLEAQSDEYNIVPEFSSPILLPLLVLVIALALVFSTKRFPRKLLIPDLSANQEISYTDSRRDSSPLGGFEEYVACRIL